MKKKQIKMKIKKKQEKLTLKKEHLQFLIETYYDYQKVRIATKNRLMFLDETPEYFTYLGSSSESFEKTMEKQIVGIIGNEDIYTKYLKKIKGIGPVMSACLISWLGMERTVMKWKVTVRGDNAKDTILPIYAEKIKESDDKIFYKLPPVMKLAERPSSLIRYCGLEPKNQKKKGEHINYNPKLKTLMLGKIGKQLLMAKGRYAMIYNEAKKDYAKRCPEVKKGSKKLFIHRTAVRIMVRIFLINLWKVYRKLNKLSITQPYADKLNHDIIPVFIEKPKYEELDWIDNTIE